jgi:hypothetical protein
MLSNTEINIPFSKSKKTNYIIHPELYVLFYYSDIQLFTKVVLLFNTCY